WVRSYAIELGLDSDFYKDADVHIHVPAGSIPKDGPSAGVTMVTALVSALTNTPIRPKLAMTGEITLSGHVLPVGGIKEKVLAARRAKIEELILPAQNEKNEVEDIQPELLKEIKPKSGLTQKRRDRPSSAPRPYLSRTPQPTRLKSWPHPS